MAQITQNYKNMKVKELIQELAGLPAEMPVVLCNLNDDGDGDGVLYLREIKSVDKGTARRQNKSVECAFINFEG